MYSDAYVTLTGNLVRDPELKTVNEKNVCSFVIAVNTGKKNISAPGQPYIANYYNCSAWGDTGAYLMEKIEKGTQVKMFRFLRCLRPSRPMATFWVSSLFSVGRLSAYFLLTWLGEPHFAEPCSSRLL